LIRQLLAAVDAGIHEAIALWPEAESLASGAAE
jgi:hypothetical protein